MVTLRFRNVLILVFLCALEAMADESLVGILYKQFVAGSNHSKGYVAFERIIVRTSISIRPAMSRGDKKTGEASIPPHQYWSFLWDGPRFVLALSYDSPLTHANDLASSSKLYGYDGQIYWGLNRSALHTFPAGSEASGRFPPGRSASILALIPQEERDLIKGPYRKGVDLDAILELAKEFRSVVQFGCSLELLKPPLIAGSNLTLVTAGEPEQWTLQLTGPIDRPDTLDNIMVINEKLPLRVSIDYPADSVTIARLSALNKAVVRAIRYQILAVGSPGLTAKESMFRWQTHKRETTGEVVGEYVNKGAVRRATFTKDDQIVPGELLVPTKELIRR